MFNKTLLAFLLTSSLLGGCVAPVGDDEVAGTQNELRNRIDVTLIDYDPERGEFTVGIELDRSVLASRNARYLVAQLFYAPPEGAGVSPFSGTPVSEIDFTPVGRTRLAAELFVEGPRPSDIDDVVARVSAAPTPHP